MPTSVSDWCADCGRRNNLTKCSKDGCSSQLCPECVDQFSGKHCNGCYVSRNVGALTGGLPGF
jgi:hypothetical protein